MVYSGTWLILATTGIILLLFALGLYWAWKHGQFDDAEAAKYAMLKDDQPPRGNNLNT
ncbi:MAG: cbb3-type cytochrome oxidase assembly protein [Chloroflexi bacterium]|nr:cbb3-type cytochrome oxidase assembly protein [Chloroflexota bacterium]